MYITHKCSMVLFLAGAFSFLFQISYSFATFFTSIILLLFDFISFFLYFLFHFSFFFFLLFLPSWFFLLWSPLLSTFLQTSCYFYLSYFQLISGLWQASHGISKITLHFCPLIIVLYWGILEFMFIPLIMVI